MTTSPVERLIAFRHRHDTESTPAPAWDAVAAAIRRLDDHDFPIVQLDCGDDDTIFNVIGGNGRYALFHLLGEWQFVDPAGSAAEVRLWTSGQGYLCAERNTLTDVEWVLRIVRAFYETGSYEGLDAVT